MFLVPLKKMEIYLDILVIRISKGTNNCGHCVLEKIIYFRMWPLSPLKFLKSYLPRVPTILTTTVYI